MKKTLTVLTTLFLLININLFAWTEVTRIDHEQPAPGELIVYIYCDTQPGESVAAEVRWGSNYRNTRDHGTTENGSFLGGTANWKVTFNTGELPTSGNIDYQVMGIGTDGNFYSHSGFNWTVDAALPVELTTFTAQLLENQVQLSWETATEVNNYGFAIERKSENTEWKKVAFVNGHGNSNSPKTYSYIDNKVLSGTYKYRLKQIDFDGKFEYSDVVEINLSVPQKFELNQNYPNPFNPSTNIKFSLPKASNVTLKVFNAIGEEVATLINKNLAAGNHSVNFNGSNLISGIYFYQLATDEKSVVKKMLLVK